MRYVVIGLLMAVLFPIGVLADESSLESALRWFDTMDGDHSGTLDEKELVTVQKTLFIQSDYNKDGAVTLDEYLFGIPTDRADVRDKVARRFKAIDQNQDTRAKEDEFIEFAVRVIQSSDLDKNGTTTRDEFAQAVSQ